MASDAPNAEQVSIVLCTYNRPDLLKGALSSLASQQTCGEFEYEIVVVCGGDKQASYDVIDAVSADATVPIRRCYVSQPGQVHARNRAISEAKHPWLAHFDDDQIADPNWLIELVRTARSRNARVVGGAMLLKLPEGCDRRLSWRCRRMLGGCVGWTEERPYTVQEGPGTGTVMIHRSVFDEIGLFDASFTLRGYDADLYRRIREAGIAAWYTPRSIAHHVTPPERLTDAYFQEICLHNGWHFARRDILERGKFAAAVRAAARMAQSAVVHVPQWGIARLTGGREDLLTARCSLWRTQGYVRSTAYWLLGRLAPQHAFQAKYPFVHNEGSDTSQQPSAANTERPNAKPIESAAV